LRERLAWANVKKDEEIMQEVLTHLHTLRDTWKEVMKKTNNGNSVA
jgi:flagellar protein FliS